MKSSRGGVYLGGAYEEKLARTKSLQSGKAPVLPVRQGVPGFVRNLQGSNIGDVLVPRHVPVELGKKKKKEKTLDPIEIQRTSFHSFESVYLYGDVVPVKLNFPPETPGVEPGDALDSRFELLPRLGRDPEPLIDVHIGVQWQSASMKIEGVEDLVADHRSQGRVRRVRRSAVPGPRPSVHHRQRDA